MIRAATCALLLAATATSLSAQAPSTSFVPFEGLATGLRSLPPGLTGEVKEGEIAAVLTEQTQELALYALGAAVYASLVEEGRFDKQIGTTAGSAGSTSLVSRGSVPALLGLAVESGALYQSVSGSIVTFRVNPSGLARALASGSYWLAGPPLNPTALEQGISRLSASVSFDLQQGSSKGTFTGERSQLKEATLRYEVINRRDPRHSSHAASIGQLRGDMTVVVETVTTYFKVLSGLPDYNAWRTETAGMLAGIDLQDDRALRAALVTAGNQFASRFASHPELRKLGGVLVEEIRAYRSIRDKVFQSIAKSSTLTVEYALNRLTLPDAALASLPTGTSVPDVSTTRVIFASPLGHVAEATLNGSATFFNSTLPQMRGNLRDLQIAGSVDVRLPEVERVGRLILTFAAMGAFLHQQPFGVKVALQGVETDDGSIGVFQTKLTIPAGGGGAQIPVSFTYANRSEFNSEKEVRGSIGVTFDLDKLFAR